jgi:RimJ/RimL family protein N-acetyltransferase
MATDRRIQNAIFTERLNLEKLNTDDYDFINTLVNSKGWIENIGDRNIHSKNDAVAFIDKILVTENFYYWVVRTKDANTPMGIISFLKRSYLDHFDIGFAFLPAFSNKGFAYEAAKAVLHTMSRQPAFKIVLATTLHTNINSIKLLIKLGFRFEKEIEIENEIKIEKAKLLIYTNAPLN